MFIFCLHIEEGNKKETFTFCIVKTLGKVEAANDRARKEKFSLEFSLVGSMR